MTEIEQAQNDLRAIVGTPEGRRFFARMITKSGLLFMESFDRGSETGTAFNLGAQSVARNYVQQIRSVDHDSVIEIMKEVVKKS